MPTIEFRGEEFEYDVKPLKSWKFQRALARMDEESKIFESADAILCGRADEAAERLDDDIEAMGELLAAIAEKEGAQVKN